MSATKPVTGPTSVVAVRGNASLSVTWVAPTNNGGSAITNYIVKYSSNNGLVWTRFFPSPAGPITSPLCVVTGLVNGTSYVVKVVAQNAIGISPSSANSAPVIPVGVPSEPKTVVVVSGNQSLVVKWVAPTNNGGSAITNYLVKYSSNNGLTYTNFVHPVSTALSLVVTGLTNGTSYVVKVVAQNAIGISPPSVNSASATPRLQVPSAPSSVVAISNNASLSVTWAAPTDNGGSAITNYIVKYSKDNGKFWNQVVPSPNVPSTSTSRIVTGLGNGIFYIFKVVAKNAIGISLPSANSARATPSAQVPSAPSSVIVLSKNEALSVFWNAPVSDGGSSITDYLVEYSSDNGLTYTNFVHPVSTDLGLIVTGLTNGTSYVIKVAAQNAIGISPSSANSAPATPMGTASSSSSIYVAGCNSANCNRGADWDTPDFNRFPSFEGINGNLYNGNVTTVGSNGGPSAYGTYDQSGNVLQWYDRPPAFEWGITGILPGIRGGGWTDTPQVLSSVYRSAPFDPRISSDIGFRLVSLSNPLNLDFVTVGDINNHNENEVVVSPLGSVSYVYMIGTVPITNLEYAHFLNCMAWRNDPYSLYNPSMSVGLRGGIQRTGVAGQYYYHPTPNYENKPVILVNWFDCARYCNWLSNNEPCQGEGQTNRTTEDGAYTMRGFYTYRSFAPNAINPNTRSAPTYRLPTENEWYKAAYYKGGSTTAGYWKYATQSDSEPTSVSATVDGNGILTCSSSSSSI